MTLALVSFWLELRRSFRHVTIQSACSLSHYMGSLRSEALSQARLQRRKNRAPNSSRHPLRTLASGVTLHSSMVHRDRTLLTGYHVRAGYGSHFDETIGGCSPGHARGVRPSRPVRNNAFVRCLEDSPCGRRDAIPLTSVSSSAPILL